MKWFDKVIIDMYKVNDDTCSKEKAEDIGYRSMVKYDSAYKDIFPKPWYIIDPFMAVKLKSYYEHMNIEEYPNKYLISIKYGMDIISDLLLHDSNGHGPGAITCNNITQLTKLNMLSPITDIEITFLLVGISFDSGKTFNKAWMNFPPETKETDK